MALWTRVVWIWTWCARGRTRGDSPQSAGLGKLGVARWIFVVALDLWDHLGRRVSPMLAVYATDTVVVTVAAGTQCAWYGLTGPLDAEQSPPGPGTWYLILYMCYELIQRHTYLTVTY